MADLLAGIVARKREEIAARLGGRRTDAAPTSRSLAAALARPGARYIMEVKKKSPSGHSSGIAVQEAAAAYAPVADAISVLTDGPGFGGSLDDLRLVRKAFDGPILAKDFIVDPYQVYESRAAGADAILLIAECLETSEMIDLQILATEMNMTVLIEVHDLDNLMRVRDRVIGFPHRSYSLLGINNRDLRTFKTDLGTTLRVTELIDDKDVLVSESGIHTNDDIKKLASAGVRAVLVGESLMKSEDIGGKIRELLGTNPE